MKNLNYEELIEINGGCPECHVSSNGSVQSGYSWGYHIGQAIGESISNVGSIIKHLSPFSWVK